jgi:HK97 gp10 family phage protein
MSMAQSRIIGLDAIKRKLEALPEQLRRKAYRSALSSGARVIAKAAKRKVGKGESGMLKKSIGIKYLPATTRSQALGLVGPKRGNGGIYNGQRRNPTRYAHLVEKGTRHSAAKPFLRPAMIETQSEVFMKMSAMIDRAIARELAKGGAR